MVAGGSTNTPSLFWRSSETCNLWCNIRLTSIFFIEKKFNGPTFLKFVKKLLELSDKVAIVMDAAPQHKTKKFKKFVKQTVLDCE